MIDPNFILLYVDNPKASAVFYEKLLGQALVEVSPTFALFALASGIKLGLWSRHTVEPAANAPAGAAELAFAVSDQPALTALYKDWQERGLLIIQPPITMDFGVTFVAVDPDGHRLRVFVPMEG